MRLTSSLRSLVDRSGRYYARGHGLSRWPLTCCGECRMTSTLYTITDEQCTVKQPLIRPDFTAVLSTCINCRQINLDTVTSLLGNMTDDKICSLPTYLNAYMMSHTCALTQLVFAAALWPMSMHRPSVYSETSL